MSISLAEAAPATVTLPKTHTYKTLDAWRGIASLWVVLFHSSAPLMDKYHLQSNPLYALPLSGYLGVWMFFVISGYCIAHAATQALARQNGLRTYVVARFRRIYLPCWFSLVLYIGLSTFATFLVAHSYLKSSVLAQRSILHHGILFYLSNVSFCYEVGFYALVGIAIAFTMRFGNGRTLLSGLHSLTIGSLIFFITAPHKIVYPFDYWPQFGFGILVYDLIKYGRQITKIAFGFTVTLFITFAWLHPTGVGYHGIGGRIPFLFGLLFAVTILLLHHYDDRLSRIPVIQWLSWLGLFSYSLYLTHVLVVGVVLQVLGRLHLEIPWLCVITSAVASVTFAYGFYQLFERPFTRKKQSVRALPEAGPV